MRAFPVDKLGHPVTIQRETAGAVDRYGQSSKTWGTVATTFGFIDQQGASETNGVRVSESEHDLLILPPGTDIRARDRVVFNGARYLVDGPPEEVRRPQSDAPVYVTAALKYQEG